MFERSLAEEILYCIGIWEPTRQDLDRFRRRLKLDEVSAMKKLVLLSVLRALNTFSYKEETPDAK